MKRIIVMILVALLATSAVNAQNNINNRKKKTGTSTSTNKQNSEVQRLNEEILQLKAEILQLREENARLKAIKDDPIIEKEEYVKEEVYRAVEQMPVFPGGEAALMKWVNNNIQYPPEAKKYSVEGRVVVQFVVTKTGTIGEVKVVRSLDPDLDKEAVRVCKTLPQFRPGRFKGKAVNVWYTLPIQFKLNGL